MCHFRHAFMTMVILTAGYTAGFADVVESSPSVAGQRNQSSFGRRAKNMNARSVSTTPEWQSKSAYTRKPTPVTASSFITVLGAVRSPSVFETSDQSVPLRTLIERAGGETEDSIGTFCLMEQGHTRSLVSLRGSLDQEVFAGQIVYVAPRGGRTSREVDLRQARADRLVLISGVGNEPFLFNMGTASWTLESLLVALGQSPEMVGQKEVKVIPPGGGMLSLSSTLPHNTVVHFAPGAARIECLQGALENGFPSKKPIKLDSALPQQSTLSTPTYRVSPAPLNTLSPPRPGDDIPLLPSPVLSETSVPQSKDTGIQIEPAGSSIPFDEPMPFPHELKIREEALQKAPLHKPEGRAPLMLPRNWKADEEVDSFDHSRDPVRTINRTSAGQISGPHQIITAAAEFEEPEDRQKPTKSARDHSLAEPENSTNVLVAGSGPQSWVVLALVAGVAGASVIVTRYLSRPLEFQRESISQSEEPLQESAEACSAELQLEKDQRFLERLILNKVPVVEENIEWPATARLHGAAVGGRRMVIHESHDGVSGPHFKIREARDTREMELKLRKLLRSSTRPVERNNDVVHTSGMRDVQPVTVGPLERALRTVDRGVTQ